MNTYCNLIIYIVGPNLTYALEGHSMVPLGHGQAILGGLIDIYRCGILYSVSKI